MLRASSRTPVPWWRGSLTRSRAGAMVGNNQLAGQQRQFHPSPTAALASTGPKRFFAASPATDKKDNDIKSAVMPTSNDALVQQDEKMIDLDISCNIQGEESQIVTVDLTPGQTLRAESGSMLYMTRGVEMETTTSQGGWSSGMKRVMTGQNLFLTDFRYTGTTSGQVALGTDFPSKILKLNLEDYPDHKLICQRGAYLASNPSVSIEMEFTKKFTTGFFGGEGFILQALVGQGHVLVKGGGTICQKKLREGETLRVASGSLVAFTSTVSYNVTTMSGFQNVVFGGEGLFVTTLTGPGTVWLQGMPPDRMISEIARRVPSGGIGLGVPIGMGGGGTQEGEDEVDPGVDEESSEQDMVAASDAAVEADRQATVASSGAMSDDSSQPIDPESSEALFGDVASKEPPEPLSSESGSGFGDDSSSTFSEDFPEMEDTTSFSTERDWQEEFQKDETSFSTFEDGNAGGDEFFDSGGADSGELPDVDDGEGGSGIGSVLRTLWDLFTDDE